LIHASQKFDLQGYRWILANHEALGLSMDKIPARADFTLGAIVGAAIFGGAVNDELYLKGEAPTLTKSPWFFGPVGWLISDALDLAEPVPMKGRLGLFEVKLTL
jgi:hypothetical protein